MKKDGASGTADHMTLKQPVPFCLLVVSSFSKEIESGYSPQLHFSVLVLVSKAKFLQGHPSNGMSGFSHL